MQILKGAKAVLGLAAALAFFLGLGGACILAQGTSLEVGGEVYTDELHVAPFPCIACHESETPTGPPAEEGCGQCHGSQERVAQLTADVVPNPHDSHLGPVECNVCHMVHSESTNYCNLCHAWEMTLPETER